MGYRGSEAGFVDIAVIIAIILVLGIFVITSFEDIDSSTDEMPLASEKDSKKTGFRISIPDSPPENRLDFFSDISRGIYLETYVGEMGDSYNVRTRKVYFEDGEDSVFVKNKIGNITILEDRGPLYLKNGLTEYMSKTETFSLSEQYFKEIVAGVFTFRVVGTNRYGRLKIDLNGHVIFDKIAEPGIYNINLLEYRDIILEEENTIFFETTGSGWRIWAPATYILSDIKILIEQGINRVAEKKFTLTNQEIASWIKGRLVFEVEAADNSGDLLIELNNFTVFRGMIREKTTPVYSLDFSCPVNILRYNNVLRLKTSEGGLYHLTNLQFYVFYTNNVVKVKNYEFNLTGEHYRQIKQHSRNLTLRFAVEDVKNEAHLNIYVMNRNGAKAVFSRKIGEDIEYAVNIEPRYIVPGYNNLQLSINGTAKLGKLILRVGA